METVMTLEEFHQLVLFHLIDADIPDKYKWIAIDGDGELFGFNNRPTFRNHNQGWFERMGEKSTFHYKTRKGRYNNIGGRYYITIKLPSNITPMSCLWKL